MSNSYSLTQSVVDSIRHIDEACYNANIDVTNALIDNYAKDIEMRMYGEQFLQEGSWLERSPDENILKTIFLAIPRFIVHLVKLIKQRWQNMKLAKINEKAIADQEEALRELKEAEAEYEKWKNFFNGIPNVKYDEKTERFYYYSDIKDYDALCEYYDAMVTYFVSYEEMARDFTSTMNISDVMHFSVNRELNRNVFSNRNDTKYLLSPDFKQLMDEILEKQEVSVKKIEVAMQNVNKWYTKIMKSNDGEFKQSDIEMINRLLDDVRKVREDFAKVDERAFRSITSAKDSFILLQEKCEEYNKQSNEDKKKQLFENDEE